MELVYCYCCFSWCYERSDWQLVEDEDDDQHYNSRGPVLGDPLPSRHRFGTNAKVVPSGCTDRGGDGYKEPILVHRVQHTACWGVSCGVGQLRVMTQSGTPFTDVHLFQPARGICKYPTMSIN